MSHLFKSSNLFSYISGAVYPGVPPGGAYGVGTNRANPKSQTFKLKSAATRMFSGLMSQWATL